LFETVSSEETFEREKDEMCAEFNVQLFKSRVPFSKESQAAFATRLRGWGVTSSLQIFIAGFGVK